MIKKGNLVEINYAVIKLHYLKNIQESKKKNPFYSVNIGKEIMENELNEMKEYDKINGKVRKIIDISYHDYLGKRIARYELDNKFVYYESELIRVK